LHKKAPEGGEEWGRRLLGCPTREKWEKSLERQFDLSKGTQANGPWGGKGGGGGGGGGGKTDRMGGDLKRGGNTIHSARDQKTALRIRWLERGERIKHKKKGLQSVKKRGREVEKSSQHPDGVRDRALPQRTWGEVHGIGGLVAGKKCTIGRGKTGPGGGRRVDFAYERRIARRGNNYWRKGYMDKGQKRGGGCEGDQSLKVLGMDITKKHGLFPFSEGRKLGSAGRRRKSRGGASHIFKGINFVEKRKGAVERGFKRKK